MPRYLGYTDGARADADLTIYTKLLAPFTVGTLLKYSAAAPARVSNSVYREADAQHQIIIGLNATVNAAQVANSPTIVIGENSTAWGAKNVCIGDGNTAGQTSAKDGQVVIGNGLGLNGKNAIRIGSSLAFGAVAGDQGIAIGCQSSAGTDAISIGRGVIASATGIAIGHTASTNGTTNGIAIGASATCGNVGVNHESIVIGNNANAGVNNGQTAIAIGRGATATNALASKLIAIGESASITANVTNVICIGAGATSARSNEMMIGSDAAGQCTLFTIKAGAAVSVRHRAGTNGGWAVTGASGLVDNFFVDDNATAGETRAMLYDVTGAALTRVKIGPAASGPGGVGRALWVA